MCYIHINVFSLFNKGFLFIDRIQGDPFEYGLLLHRNRGLVYGFEGWELYDEIHRRQRTKIPVGITKPTAQMYFQEQVPKGAIAVMLNVKRRAVCRVLAEWNEIARAFYFWKVVRIFVGTVLMRIFILD